MAAPATASIIRVPGTLSWNGTSIGTTRDQELVLEWQVKRIWDEFAGARRNSIYCGAEVLFKAVLRYPDTDAIAAVFPDVSGASFRFRPTASGATRAGTSITPGVMLWTPLASAAHPAVRLWNACPRPEVAARIQFRLDQEWGLAVAFEGTFDSSGRTLSHGVGV